MRGVADVNDSVKKQQSRTIHLAQVIKRHVPCPIVAVPGSADGRLNPYRATELLGTAREVQRV